MSAPLAIISNAVIHTVLENGTPVCIRAIGTDDEPLMREGIARLSAESRYLRFFSVQPMPPDPVIDRLVDVDGHRHLAWGAIADEEPGQPAIGAVHAIREAETSRSADFSVAILDDYQRVGLARMLVAVLLTHCRIEGIARLEAQVLTHNDAARGLVAMLCGQQGATDMGVTEYVLDTAAALRCLRAEADTPAMAALLDELAGYG